MTKYFIDKLDWKVIIPNITIGWLLSMIGIAIIIGYNVNIYDISHVLLFMMLTLLWCMEK